MKFFDFHHHDLDTEYGIYNLNSQQAIPDFPFSAGIHPNAVEKDLDAKLDWLEDVALSEYCIAIGECGLDARYPTELAQKTAFEQQMKLANRLNKPLIIHCVKRFSEVIQVLKTVEVPVIIHGFNKRSTIGRDLLRHDYYLSFGKSLLYNVNLQEFFREIPLEKILLETDSAMVDLAEIYTKAAMLKNLSREELALNIKENLRTLNIR